VDVSGQQLQLLSRIGGTRALSAVYATVAAILFAVSQSNLPAVATLVVFIVCMATLGMGNGAVFQLVPQRFGRDIGLMTGLIGMAGGIGGFLLAAGLGIVKQHTGSYALGLWLFAGCALLAWGLLSNVKQHWRSQWAAAGAARV
jgi:NNP family nitrate/nitrite transporter-like MFS transporter